MRHYMKIGLMVVGACLLLSTTASAQEQDHLTLRVEPGVAIPLTTPQSQRFKIGGDLAIKPEVGIGSYFSFGPALTVLALPSNVSGIDTGTAWTLGGFARVKRPHDAKNTDTGWAAVSPWVDADAQYAFTGPLERFGWAVAVGASVPTSDARNIWIGPFVRYQGVYQEDKPGYDSNSAKILIVGLSVELGEKVHRKEVSVPQPPPPPPPPVVVVVNEPPPLPPVIVYHDENIEVQQTIQFAYDSPVLDDTANTQLTAVVKQLSGSKSFQHMSIEGHASSEGQVEYNNELSMRRAQSVLDFMASNGVARDKMTASGFGSSVPVATNKTNAGRILNRRVEFVVKFTVTKEGK